MAEFRKNTNTTKKIRQIAIPNIYTISYNHTHIRYILYIIHTRIF